MDSEQEDRRKVGRQEPVAAKQNYIQSSQLFAGANELQIYHNGEVYRLRITKSGKLILNK